MSRKQLQAKDSVGRLVSCSSSADVRRFTPEAYAKIKCLDTPGGGAHYVNLLNQLAFDRTTPFSVRLRYKQSAPHGSLYAILVGRANNPTNNNGWCVIIAPTSGYPYLWMANSSEYASCMASQNVCTGSWYDLVVTFDGSSAATGLNFYVNGSLPTQSQTGTLTINTLQAASGAIFTPSTNNNIAGRISEVAVWNRVLTATEVLQTYNGGSSPDLRCLPSSSPALTNWWWCGDGIDVAGMVYDRIGSAHGIVTGSVTIVTDS